MPSLMSGYVRRAYAEVLYLIEALFFYVRRVPTRARTSDTSRHKVLGIRTFKGAWRQRVETQGAKLRKACLLYPAATVVRASDCRTPVFSDSPSILSRSVHHFRFSLEGATVRRAESRVSDTSTPEKTATPPPGRCQAGELRTPIGYGEHRARQW
jgi:hypothetical protein